MKIASVLGFAAAVAATHPTVYIIRHGEKPADDNVPGLTATGKARAQCLRTIFGAKSTYDIGKILVQQYNPSGARRRPFDTVEPLATDLGITIDSSCDRDDDACVKKAVESYKGPGNVLICWEHYMLSVIANSWGGHQPDYPQEFDIIWTEPYPYKSVTSSVYEHCPNIKM